MPRPQHQAGAQPQGGPGPGPTARPRGSAPGRGRGRVHPRAGGKGAGSSSLALDGQGREGWEDVRSRGGLRSWGPRQPVRTHHRAKRFAAAAANTSAAAHELSRNAANSQSRESRRRKSSEARHKSAFQTIKIHTFPVLEWILTLFQPSWVRAPSCVGDSLAALERTVCFGVLPSVL